MTSRRQVLTVVGSGLVLAPLVAWVSGPAAARPTGPFPVAYDDAEWRARLSDDQYRVLRRGATERPGTSALTHEMRDGVFVCAGCGQRLFASATKYDSGTGWPSFQAPLDGAVGTAVDRSYFMVRVEVYCARCGGHLGHVFEDGPPPSGRRYCINGAALRFQAGG